jgi:NAD(P)H-dependent flavin oxidoreductase YrpB (nitropropane dioxygenase family)
MKTKICEMLGIEVPIFAFSHCRDVVIEVSKAGGFGVLGVTYQTPEDLEGELKWIDDHIGGKPYGIDVLLPGKYENLEGKRVTPDDLPKEQAEFMRRVLDEAGIPPLPAADRLEMLQKRLDHINMTPQQIVALVNVALKHPIKALVSGLGAPWPELRDDLHSRGILIGALAGKAEHARRHKAAGVDFVVAQGMEAGGHTGTITSMLLWPDVVDAVAPMPVLAAGGIGRGRQMAAAMAMGAQGVWCGSIWLGTRESEVVPDVKEKFYAAGFEDTVQTRMRSGKPARLLKSKLSEAWARPDAPPFAPMPFQTMVMAEPHMRVERGKLKEWKYYPVGMVVGQMKEENTVRQVIHDMLNEFLESTEQLGALVNSD